jgi:hypothetical protein
MTTPIPATLFADPVPAQRLEKAAAELTAHGFTVEILHDAAAVRTRIKDLIPEGASVFTGASETSACPASMPTSTPAGDTTPSGHAARPWTAPPKGTRSGG